MNFIIHEFLTYASFKVLREIARPKILQCVNQVLKLNSTAQAIMLDMLGNRQEKSRLKKFLSKSIGTRSDMQ